MNSRILMAMMCAAGLAMGAAAESWNLTADKVLYATDQPTLDNLESITIASGKRLYVAAGNVATVKCEIVSSGVPVLGKLGTGTLVIAGKLSIPDNLTLCGDVRFSAGASFGSGFKVLQDDGNDLRNVFRLGAVFPSGSSLPTRFHTRAYTTFAFDADNVFAEVGNKKAIFVLGRASNQAGIVDLNGHDQTISSMSFHNPFAQMDSGKFATFAEYHQIKSETDATLTVTNGFYVYTTGAYPVFNGRLMGGISFKLDAPGGTASFSNVLDQSSTTTGSLICAAGTLNLQNGARFTALSSIRKEGTGNIVIATSDIATSVDLYLDGTGKLTLDADLVVSHIYTNDTQGGWVYLDAGYYDGTSLGAHLAGTGQVRALYSAPRETVVYTWSGAGDGLTLSSADNWEGHEAPTLASDGEQLVFPATGTSSFRVDGAITVGGIQIAYPGAFTVEAGENALINLGLDGISVADTTAQTNAVTFNVPIHFASGAQNVLVSVGTGTALDFEGELSAEAMFGRQLIITGGKLTLGGVATNLLIEMVVSEPTALTVKSASGLGAVGATITSSDGVVLPYFTGTRTCTSPWTSFANYTSDMTYKQLYPKVADTPFVFFGAVALYGTRMNDAGDEYTGYACLTLPNDTTFRGGVTVGNVSRLQLDIPRHVTLSFLDNPLVRGFKNAGSQTDIRFYGAGATNSFVVTDQSLASYPYSGVYVSQCSLVCAADFCLNGFLTPYVNTRDPAQGDPIWSRIDLNGHSQNMMRLLSVTQVISEKFPRYPNSYVEIASRAPAALTLGEVASGGRDIHQMKFTGAVSFKTASPWGREFAITNTVSTTSGNLEVTAGLVEFQCDAGWAGGTNVVVSGTGVLRMSAGTKAFAPLDGTQPKVALALSETGTLDIPSAATTVTVLTCETNGVRLARGTYTAATLPDFLTGSGSLKVRSASGVFGTLFSLR